jgi:hypothetical protein
MTAVILPFAEKKLIPAGINDPYIIPIGVILHVDAANQPDLYSYFNGPSGGIESHCHIRRDGHIYQYRAFNREADANYKANSFIGRDGRRYGFISYETQGFGEGEWTDEQMDSIRRALLWHNEEHRIPLRVCPGPFSPGIGYHTLFGAPSEWTPVAKSCAGPDRKEQFHNTLVPWFKDAEEEDDMPYSDWPKKDKEELVSDVVNGLLSADLFPKKEDIEQSVRNALKGGEPTRTPTKKAQKRP